MANHRMGTESDIATIREIIDDAKLGIHARTDKVKSEGELTRNAKYRKPVERD